MPTVSFNQRSNSRNAQTTTTATTTTTAVQTLNSDGDTLFECHHHYNYDSGSYFKTMTAIPSSPMPYIQRKGRECESKFSTQRQKGQLCQKQNGHHLCGLSTIFIRTGHVEKKRGFEAGEMDTDTDGQMDTDGKIEHGYRCSQRA